ncbi:MAG: class I SAM-dependent methyltransferase [Planctomycetes bacterium]|nr:class I SAM-dependent methyltransferase [Planctomycetota bacterium]
MSTTTTAADHVRELYESRPYPSPERDLDVYRDLQRTVDGSPRFFFHMYWPTAAYREDLEVLVAGCGTSQAAKLAIQQPGARVTAIDVSTSSLQCTETLRERYALENLELHELPLERVGELDRTFDLVVSTGVLHHLPDPAAGLSALRGVLDRDGAMFLMVYGRHGRAGIRMLQEYGRRLGIRCDDADLSGLLAVAAELPDDHPARVFTARGNDLSNPTGLADALLHPQECDYDVPELFEWLGSAGLDHARWFHQAPYLPFCGWPSTTPHAARIATLPAPEQYAALELLRGTMITHAFVATRDDRVAPRAIDLDAEGWESVVPVFFNGCRVDQEGLPPEIAGVLRNTAHLEPDLLVPLTVEQAMLYNAMDGTRTIAEIIAASGVDADPVALAQFAREFFRQLAWSDQVMLRRGM